MPSCILNLHLVISAFSSLHADAKADIEVQFPTSTDLMQGNMFGTIVISDQLIKLDFPVLHWHVIWYEGLCDTYESNTPPDHSPFMRKPKLYLQKRLLTLAYSSSSRL